MTRIGSMKKSLSDLLEGVSDVLKDLKTEGVIIRDSINEKEAAYLDAVGIRDTGGPDSLRKNIELVWRLEQYCGWRNLATNFFCCFAIGWLFMMNSGWVGDEYAAVMASLAWYPVVLLSFCYTGRGLADFNILLSADRNSLLSHDPIYEAFPLRWWVAGKALAWATVIVLCYLSDMVPLIRIFVAGILIVSGAGMLLRGKIAGAKFLADEGFPKRETRYE